jgi:hypothetical protein
MQIVFQHSDFPNNVVDDFCAGTRLCGPDGRLPANAQLPPFITRDANCRPQCLIALGKIAHSWERNKCIECSSLGRREVLFTRVLRSGFGVGG